MLLTCVLVAPGCGGSDDTGNRGAAWEGAEYDSAGVRVVSNPSVGTWTDETRWTVEKDLTIGVRQGAPEYEFGRVVDVAVGSDGRIYVLDQQAAEIRVFDAEGSHLFSFGGSGQGPGELSSQDPTGARAVLMSPAGELFVPDQNNIRVNRFASDGEFLGSFPIRLENGVPVAWSVSPNEHFISHHSSRSWNGLLRIAPTGELLDTVAEFDVRPPSLLAEGRRPALEHAALWTVLADGTFVTGLSDRPRIEIRSPEGRLQMVIRTNEQDLALSREDRGRFLQRFADIWAAMFRARGESEAWIESQLRQIPQGYVPPDRRPAFTGFVAGPRGTIWVRTALPIDSMTSAILEGFRSPLRGFWSPVWEVYSSQGRLLGEVILPDRFTLHRIHNSSIYGVERDDLGVQRVVRLRINVQGARRTTER